MLYTITMNTSTGHLPNNDTTQQLIKAVFDAPNNRTMVFTPVRNTEDKIIDFRFSLISQASLAFFGGQDYTGQLFSEVRPDQLQQISDMAAVIETGKTHSWERLNKDVNGVPQWYSVSDAKVGESIVRVWENITDRKISEDSLTEIIARKAEEKYLSLFNSIDQGFCIIEVIFDETGHPYDYIFLDYNPAFEKQTGLKDARGKRIKDLNPLQEQHWFDLYGDIVNTRQPKYFEQEAVLIDGWYEVSAFPLTKEKDNKVAVIFNDVSDRKKAEKKLNAFNARLEAEVEERTSQLNLANILLEEKNEELEKNNKELESFNYVASHDLQEPLRKIQTFLSMITQRKDDPVAVQNYMAKIHSSADRMSQLIQDVLTYSSLNSDNNFTQVDLNKVIDNVISDFELVIAERNATINKDNLPAISAIPLQMHQLFSNLISNSLKYNNGLPIIAISHKFIDIDNHKFIEITFSDNGIGFDEQYSDQIFKLFHRLHTKSEFNGTGVGLSICKKIVEQHHGTISATSVAGNGATFIIQLPL